MVTDIYMKNKKDKGHLHLKGKVALLFKKLSSLKSVLGIGRSTLTMPEEVREFHIAVMRNDIAKVQELVDAGIDVNYPWMNAESPSIKDGSTPLCEAVSLNHHSIVQKLIDSGAIVNKPDYFGCTPLHKSSYHGRATLTAVLINAGAEVKLYDHNLNTPLQVCTQSSVVHNNVDTARVLIEAGADVNAPNRFGKIALHYAAIWGLGEMTDVLIKLSSWPDTLRQPSLFSEYVLM